jgi:hypothetical protein
MYSAGILSDFSRPGWDRALLLVSVSGEDGHLKRMIDSLQRGSFAIFEFIDPATDFVVTSLTHRPSGRRVRVFASLASAAAAAELAEACGDWTSLTADTAGDRADLWEATKAAWRAAGFEQGIWYPSAQAADSLPTWGRISERPRLASREAARATA